MDVEADLQATKRILIEYPKRLENAKNELSKVNLEISDILHVLELGNVNGPNIMKLNKELKKSPTIKTENKERDRNT